MPVTTANLFRLLILSAIWGGSFLLIRIGAPALGPVPLMEARVLLAALFLAAVALLLRRPLAWRAYWRHYLVIGLFNSALPFLLVGFDRIALQPGAGIAIAASLAAALCYAVASNYAKTEKTVEPFANAHGSMWAASLLLAPALLALRREAANA